MNDERHYFGSYDEADAYGSGEFRSLMERAVGPTSPDTARIVAGALEHTADPGRRTRLVVLAAAAVALAVLGTWATVGLLGSEKAAPVVDPNAIEATTGQTLAAVALEHLGIPVPDPRVIRVGVDPDQPGGAVQSAQVEVALLGQPVDLRIAVFDPMSQAQLKAHGLPSRCTVDSQSTCTSGSTAAGGQVTSYVEFPLSGESHGYAVHTNLVEDARVVMITETVDVEVIPCGTCDTAEVDIEHADIPPATMAAIAEDVRLAPTSTHADNELGVPLEAVWQSDPASGPTAATSEGLVTAVLPHLAGHPIASFRTVPRGVDVGLDLPVRFTGSAQELHVFVIDSGTPYGVAQWKNCRAFHRAEGSDPPAGSRCVVLPDGTTEFRTVQEYLTNDQWLVTQVRPDGSSANARLVTGKGEEPLFTLDDLAAIAEDPAISWVMPMAQACPSREESVPCR